MPPSLKRFCGWVSLVILYNPNDILFVFTETRGARNDLCGLGASYRIMTECAAGAKAIIGFFDSDCSFCRGGFVLDVV